MVFISVYKQDREVRCIGQRCGNIPKADPRTHQGDDGCETVRPRRRVVQRPGCTSAEAGNIDAVEVYVEVLQNLPQKWSKSQHYICVPPYLFCLRIENEIAGSTHRLLYAVYVIDSHTARSAEID